MSNGTRARKRLVTPGSTKIAFNKLGFRPRDWRRDAMLRGVRRAKKLAEAMRAIPLCVEPKRSRRAWVGAEAP